MQYLKVYIPLDTTNSLSNRLLVSPYKEWRKALWNRLLPFLHTLRYIYLSVWQMRTIASPESEKLVLEFFKDLAARSKVFQWTTLTGILREHADGWKLVGTSTRELVYFLIEHKVLRSVRLDSETEGYAAKRRFVTADADPFEVALSLKAHSYLTHASAVFLHGLTEQVPQTVYVNSEQSVKPRPAEKLSQERLDRAFKASQRTSRYTYVYGRKRIVLLSGKNTGRHGVVPLPLPTSERQVPATNLERTLIDITVRPVYAGGVHQVLTAYRSAAARTSVSKLLATLRVLDYMYPYHQAVGFYLARAGVAAERLNRIRALGLSYDFYLAHGLKEPAYDPSWRLFFPKGL